MFDRLTDDARQAMARAEREAVALRHGWLGTEHILLGLLGEGGRGAGAVLAGAGLTPAGAREQAVHILGEGGRAAATPDDAEALRSIGIDLDAVRASVEATFGPGALDVVPRRRRRRLRRRCDDRPGGVRLTPRAKKVLELALRESLLLRHASVGTEHLLLGLLAEGEGVAAMILGAAARPEELRERTLRALGKVA